MDPTVIKGDLGDRPADLVYPTVPFQTFYHEGGFDYVSDVMETEEWRDIYSKFYTFSEEELNIPVGETPDDLEKLKYFPDQVHDEIIKCAKSFSYFCHRYVKILHVKHGTIPFLLYNYQHRVADSFTTQRFNIVSKFRQGGLTTEGVLLGLWMCLFQQDKMIYLLSKTDREATTAGEIVDRALENMPTWIYNSKKSEISKHVKDFRKITGSMLHFYTPKAARGKTASLIIIDEAAFIDNMNTEWKGMYPTIATGGAVQVISTVNGIGNWYEEIYHEAEAGENFFKVIELDYWEHPQYANPEWAAEAKANMGLTSWKQEILRDFLGSGETYIPGHIMEELIKITRDTDPIRTAFAKWTNLKDDNRQNFDWGNGALWIWKEPIDGHEYIIGVDSSEGVGSDNSSIQVIDASSLEQIAEFYSNSVPPHIFAQICNQIGIYYNIGLLVVENVGIGGAVLSNLHHDLAYENLYYEDKNLKSGKAGIKTGPQNRSILLESIQQRLITGTVRINSRRLVRELKTFIFSNQKNRAEARTGHHDDAIFALCFALHVRDTQMRGIPIGMEPDAEMMKIFKSEAYAEIKHEVLQGSPEQWLIENDPILDPNKEDILAPVDFNIKRRHDKLLKEFGW